MQKKLFLDDACSVLTISCHHNFESASPMNMSTLTYEPALLTRTSMVPKRAFTASNAACTDSSLVTSRDSASTSTSGFAFFMMASVSASADTFLAVMMIALAPACAKASEIP